MRVPCFGAKIPGGATTGPNKYLFAPISPIRMQRLKMAIFVAISEAFFHLLVAGIFGPDNVSKLTREWVFKADLLIRPLRLDQWGTAHRDKMVNAKGVRGARHQGGLSQNRFLVAR
jgi:hypothetical protein